jgi:uncharacterized membrane protein
MFSIKSFRPANFSVSGTIHNWLLVSAAFSCLLLLARIIATDSVAYLFLPWNLFLAFVPYYITWWMTKDVQIIENHFKFYTALAVWLLFIPNSFYIITDLFHLHRFRTAPQWFDLLLIFSFAWNGLLAGIISLRRVEVLFTVIKGNGFAAMLVFVVMWLCGFGIYIGRYLRFNSWDILTDPFSLLAEMMDLIVHPLQNAAAWAMTGSYALFMTLVYFTVKKMSESFSMNR